MAKSSSHIAPVKDNSEAHNLRKTSLDYVKQERTELNESWTDGTTIRETRKHLEKVVKEKTGRSMQKSATPIKEAVIVLDKTQTMEDIKKMNKKLEERFGIKAMQIHIHEDEGHTDKKTNEWKQNRHAHIVYNWVNETDKQIGKAKPGQSFKLNKYNMSELQDIVADSLGMKRGQSSNKEHLKAMEYKRQQVEKDILELKKENEQLKKEKAKNMKKGLSETFKRIGGINEAQQLKKENMTLKNDNLKLSKDNEDLKKERDTYKDKSVLYKKDADQMSKYKLEARFQKDRANEEAKTAQKYRAYKNHCIAVATGKESVTDLKENLIRSKVIKQGRSNHL